MNFYIKQNTRCKKQYEIVYILRINSTKLRTSTITIFEEKFLKSLHEAIVILLCKVIGNTCPLVWLTNWPRPSESPHSTRCVWSVCSAYLPHPRVCPNTVLRQTGGINTLWTGCMTKPYKDPLCTWLNPVRVQGIRVCLYDGKLNVWSKKV